MAIRGGDVISLVSRIQTNDIWKEFKIRHERRTTVLDRLGGLLSIRRGEYDERFWAVKEVSFVLDEGDSMGIIGSNGSGKSTLLKMIAKVIKPTKGTMTIAGSVVPILELGVGFHPDLSVRENASVYGVIMGLRRSEIKSRLESVLGFAGLERFQDARLRTLSSGMQVRLAFSIAIQTDADTFLVDEDLG